LEGVPGLNITLGNDLIQGTALLGTMTGPLLNRYLSIKNLFLIGEVLMFIELGLVAVFQAVNLPYCLLACIMLFMFTYQCSLGSYYFVYITQVGNPSINTIGVFFIWFWVLIISIITPPMIDSLGVSATFAIFSGCAFTGAVYFWFFMKSTQGLDKEQLKVLYIPENLK